MATIRASTYSGTPGKLSGDYLKCPTSPYSTCSTVEPEGELPLLYSPQSSVAETDDGIQVEADDAIKGAPSHGATSHRVLMRSQQDTLQCVLGLLGIFVGIIVAWGAVALAFMLLWSFFTYWIWVPLCYWTIVILVTLNWLFSGIITASFGKFIMSADRLHIIS